MEIVTRVGEALCINFLSEYSKAKKSASLSDSAKSAIGAYAYVDSIKDMGPPNLNVNKTEEPDYKTIAKDFQFWARRYADGRLTVAVENVNQLTEKLILGGIECQPETTGDHKGSIWAYDGDPRICSANKYEERYGKDGKKPN